MLKRLFTSNTRVKLLTLFLLDPDKEYFIRELTRKLDEQINSVRRELDNLKQIGLLKSRMRDRKKFYIVDKHFIAFNELKSIIVKALSSREHVARKIGKMGQIDFLVLSGIFVDRSAPVDLLLVGNIDRAQLEQYLNTECETRRPVKFSILTKDDFLYRLKCKDKFLNDIINDPGNIVAIDKLR